MWNLGVQGARINDGGTLSDAQGRCVAICPQTLGNASLLWEGAGREASCVLNPCPPQLGSLTVTLDLL